jgi:hypothetical protein|tara:strand:+ start:413 stop:559 length:147 start_codon:yes stop_codon:yes gene_type:complete
MFTLFHFVIDCLSLDGYWRVENAYSIEQARKEIEETYKIKVDFIEWVK